MKKLGLILITLSMLLGLLPTTAMAAEVNTFDQKLALYLEEVSTARGFDVSKADIEKSLATYEMTLADFQSIDDMKSLLGEVIKADLSNLTSIYEAYGLNQETLTQELNEYGEELKDYIYLSDLDMALSFYTEDGEFEQEADYEAKLTAYLADVSAVRGFEVTKEDLNKYLKEYFTSTDEFETVSDLEDFLGDVIKADLSNFDYFNTEYDMSKEAVLQLIKDNGKNIEDFIYIEQVEELVWETGEDDLSGMDPTALLGMLNQLGLTEDELTNLQNHFIGLTDYLSDAEVQSKLEELGNRFMAFAEKAIENGADENYKPTDAEITEIVSLYEEMLSLFKLKVSYSLIVDGVTTPVTMAELMKLEELGDADFKIELYNSDSELLADFVITSEFIKENFGEIVEDVNNAVGADKDNKPAKPVKTVKGGKLPDTASDYIPNALYGLLVALGGIIVYRKVRKDKVEIIEK